MTGDLKLGLHYSSLHCIRERGLRISTGHTGGSSRLEAQVLPVLAAPGGRRHPAGPLLSRYVQTNLSSEYRHSGSTFCFFKCPS